MEPNLRRDELGGMFGVRRSTSTATHDVVSDVVNLVTVLVEDGRARSCTGIRTEDNAILENDTNNGGTGFASNRGLITSEEEKQLEINSQQSNENQPEHNQSADVWGSEGSTYLEVRRLLRTTLSNEKQPRADTGSVILN